LCKKAETLFADLDYIDGLGRMYKPREDALQRKENVLEFLGSLDEFDGKRGHQATLEEFLEQMALEDARDRQDRRRNDSDNSVTLMTVHASKGLEFPVVFVAGMEQKLFPHQMALDEGNEEEERRLCYVAFTRAKEQLILTYADKRRVQNETVRRLPSRFLNEFSEGLAVLSTPAKVLKPASLNDIRGYLDSLRAQFKPSQ
jgi:DNA helicase-2/ATP-dependent DNA helicase PcrA